MKVSINAYFREHSFSLMNMVRPKIRCADGLELSVQASLGHYCNPRDNEGPYSTVEIGFPSERIEELMPYAEEPENPTGTVYGYVPIALVEGVIRKHGGIAEEVQREQI